MSEIYERLGAMFKSARKKKKLLLKDVSEATGYSVTYLSDIENGKGKGSGKALDAIARSLGMRLTLVDAESEE